jgi:hypothetical protein
VQVSTLTTQARQILQDTVVPYRYSDESLVGIVNEAMYEARRVRPDLFLGKLRTSLTPVASISDQLPLSEQFFGPLVNFVVGRAEMRDDEFTNDKRATTLYGGFYAAMTKGV